MQIKGEQKPTCGFVFEYTFEWNETITKAITFYVTALRGSALFIMPDGTYTNTGKKTCGASEKSFTMKAIWLKEQENEQLIINESSIFGSTALNITPQCAKCSLTTESDAILGIHSDAIA